MTTGDISDLVPAERPEVLAALPVKQARERCRFFLLLEAVGWDRADAWDAALSLDQLMIALIKQAASAVPEEALREAVIARRTLAPDNAMLTYHSAVLNGFLRPPPSRITITVADQH